MYANASPNASATPPMSSLQHQPGVPTHMGQQPAAQHAAQAAPAAAASIAAARPQSAGASFVTGAYQSSGDPAIDRMLRLELACKRFGSLI